MLESISIDGMICKSRRTLHRTCVKRQPVSRVQVYRGDVSGSSARIALDASNRRQQQQRNDARLQEELAAGHSTPDEPSSKRKSSKRSDAKQSEVNEGAPREARDWVGGDEVDLTIYDTLDQEAERASRGRGAAPRASTATPTENGSPASGLSSDEALRRKALQLKSNLRAQNRASTSYRPSTALGLARRRMLNKYLPYEWQVALKKKAEEIPETQFNYIVSGLTLIVSSLFAGVVAWSAWPFLRETVITIFHANDIEARVLQELTFETQFLSAISLVTAILLGNTFAFSFDRQRQIIQEMSEEVFAVELLLQEAFLALSEPHLRWRIIKYVKMYVETEIQTRTTDSPFRVDGAIVGLFTVLANLRNEGKDITRMLRAVEMLAQANSRRVAVAAALLPPLHWVMLASLCSMLLVAFILFDSDFNDQVVENRVIFSLLSAMLYSILQVLQDISTPDDGLYSVRDAMDHRLTYVRWQMGHILNDPAIKISILGGDVSEDVNDSFDDDREGGKAEQEARAEEKSL